MSMYDADDPHGDALKELSIEVQFLLSHLQRLPETRIAKYFGLRVIERSSQDGTPLPPTHDLGYFLSRLGALSQAYQNNEPVVFVEPPETKKSPKMPQIEDPGPRLTDYAFLVWSRDFLAAITYPASVQTIKVTRAYREHRAAQWGPIYGRNVIIRHDASAGLPLDETSFRFGRRLASLVERYRVYTVLLIVFSSWAAIILFSGHVLVRENDGLQHREREIQTRFVSILDRCSKCDGDSLPSKPHSKNLIDFCAAQTNGAETSKVENSTDPASGDERNLCRQYRDFEKDAASWMLLSQRWRLALSPLTYLPFQVPQLIGAYLTNTKLEDPKDTSLKTERYRLDQYIEGLLGSILPVCYACLGALAALFRRLTLKVESETLGPSDFGNMSSSLILGILTGSVIGIFGDIMQTGHGNTLPVGTTALSLLAGFASDRVFTMLDAAAERVFGRGEDARVRPKLP